tara:strand:- start:280 stop:426 length:147 start_codon:yes stop_codon:yes gene_type:complete
MSKKRKLGSKNPKYFSKEEKEKNSPKNLKLVQEIKGVKIYISNSYEKL